MDTHITSIANQRESKLSADIEQSFLTTGGMQIHKNQLSVSVSDWRRLARGVGRRLGRPVQTVDSPTLVVAVLTDYPSTPEEHAARREQQRKAAESLSAIWRFIEDGKTGRRPKI